MQIQIASLVRRALAEVCTVPVFFLLFAVFGYSLLLLLWPVVLPVFVDITCAGANITTSDLSQYRVRIYPPLSVPLRSGLVIHTLRPPSSGPILAFMLRILEGLLRYSPIHTLCLLVCLASPFTHYVYLLDTDTGVGEPT